MRYITGTVFCLLIFSGCTNNQTEINTDQTDSLSENNFTQNNSDTTMITPPETEFIFSDEGFKQKFDLRAYIDDPDEEQPTNLRESPNGKVIQQLAQEEDYMFHIIAQKDGWFEINNLTSFSEEVELSATSGWLHSTVVGASTRYCDGLETAVYKFPDPSDIFFVTTIGAERSIKLKRLYYDYAEVEFSSEDGKIMTGWINCDCICGNPVTTCP